MIRLNVDGSQMPFRAMEALEPRVLLSGDGLGVGITPPGPPDAVVVRQLGHLSEGVKARVHQVVLPAAQGIRDVAKQGGGEAVRTYIQETLLPAVKSIGDVAPGDDELNLKLSPVGEDLDALPDIDLPPNSQGQLPPVRTYVVETLLPAVQQVGEIAQSSDDPSTDVQLYVQESLLPAVQQVRNVARGIA